MADREKRVSPDGDTIAIRSDNAPDAWNAWACMNAINGGYWAKETEVETWDRVTGVTPYVAPEPDPQPDPTPPEEPTP